MTDLDQSHPIRTRDRAPTAEDGSHVYAWCDPFKQAYYKPWEEVAANPVVFTHWSLHQHVFDGGLKREREA